MKTWGHGPLPRPSVRFRRIGGALRQAREERRLTLETAARRFGRSQGWLSTVENGLQIIRVDDLTDLLDFYGIPEGVLRSSLLHLAAQGRRKNWTHAFEGRISAAALDLASLEGDSASIRTYQPNLVPGLLQTEDYTRALVAGGLPGSQTNADELVAFRMARQETLAKKVAPQYHAVIGQAALHNEVGGPRVMRAQLQQVSEMAQARSIALHVLPFEASARLWLAGPFDVFTLRPPGQLTITVLDHFSQISFVEDEEAVATHEQIFAHMLSGALDEPWSLKVIRRLVSES
ncbi:helix-turn-helix transcriptional regulator [Actinomadura sp. J1-007]|uniref:helix-turn-helix domain-containing protein n=1 Tax=Actinomadura sp. J1-007 TaxID=2661913 RepID=UPI0013704E40|nr:helix-turn-helix transcriptional regulator [Actinomadura sp. J1-007]